MRLRLLAPWPLDDASRWWFTGTTAVLSVTPGPRSPIQHRWLDGGVGAHERGDQRGRRPGRAPIVVGETLSSVRPWRPRSWLRSVMNTAIQAEIGSSKRPMRQSHATMSGGRKRLTVKRPVMQATDHVQIGKSQIALSHSQQRCASWCGGILVGGLVSALESAPVGLFAGNDKANHAQCTRPALCGAPLPLSFGRRCRSRAPHNFPHERPRVWYARL